MPFAESKVFASKSELAAVPQSFPMNMTREKERAKNEKIRKKLDFNGSVIRNQLLSSYPT
jgi:hypothetical protein